MMYDLPGGRITLHLNDKNSCRLALCVFRVGEMVVREPGTL